jgi:YcaO-like protein with predicted kinase domain
VPRTAAPSWAARCGAGPRLARLAAALGVSRVARVTGLDRAGLEVACAVRPGGHVLQVTNGKGVTFAEAERGAVLEAAELACAERPPPNLSWASAPELAARGVAFVAEDELGGSPSGARLAWSAARDLATGARVLVPAAAVHVPPQGGALLGLASVRWTSNGMGAHPSWPAALLHALLEAVERDQLARALPEGFTEEAVRARQLGRGAVARAAPSVGRLVRQLGSRGLDVHLFDVAPARRIGLPVAGALLFDRERGPVPVTAGYACALDAPAALRGALLEAAQSRVTDIHGAREDVVPMEERAVERLRRACERADRGEGRPARGWPFDSASLRSGRTGKGHPTLRPDPDPDPDLDRNRDTPVHPERSAASRGAESKGARGAESKGARGAESKGARGAESKGARGAESKGARGAESKGVHRILHLLHRAGHRRVLALDLAPPSLGIHVAKVIVPGLLVSDLLSA